MYSVSSASTLPPTNAHILLYLAPLRSTNIYLLVDLLKNKALIEVYKNLILNGRFNLDFSSNSADIPAYNNIIATVVVKAIKSIINQVLKIHSIKANVIVETSVNPEILKDKSEDFRILSITSTAMSSFIGGSSSFVLSDSFLISKEN